MRRIRWWPPARRRASSGSFRSWRPTDSSWARSRCSIRVARPLRGEPSAPRSPTSRRSRWRAWRRGATRPTGARARAACRRRRSPRGRGAPAPGGRRELAREREFSEAVLDSLAGAFFLVSSDGVILRWNAALSAAIGYTDAEIGTMHPLDFVSARDRRRRRGGDARGASSRAARCRSRPRSSIARATSAPTRSAASRCASASAPTWSAWRATSRCASAPSSRWLRAKERLDLALTGSRLALWDWDLQQRQGVLQRELVVAAGRARRANPRSRATRWRGWNHPEDRAVFAAALGNAAEGRERRVRLRVPRAQRLGRMDLGALARQGHAARRIGHARCA